MKLTQLYYKTADELPKDNVNLVEGKAVYRLHIHAIPGTVFSIDRQKNFVIGPTTHLLLETEDAPLTSLYLIKAISIETYPIIIDIEWRGTNV